MPYQIFPGSLFYVALEGTIGGTDLADVLQAACASRDWLPRTPMLWDGHMIRELSVEVSALRRLQQVVTQRAEQLRIGRVALVVREADHRAAQYLRLALSGEGREIGVFDSLQDTLGWLGYSGPLPHVRAARAEQPVWRHTDVAARLRDVA